MLARSSYRCKQHLSSIHDFFISYRVASESQIAEDLFGELSALKKHNGDNIKVFWDQRCLNDAANWQEGFINGLKGSRVIILLISVDSLARMASSSGGQDNLLLEYEEALELAKSGSVAIFPVFIGTTKEVSAEFSHVDGQSGTEKRMAYFPFSFAHADIAKFPEIGHSATGRSVRATISQVFQLQGANYTVKGINHLAKQLRELLFNLEEAHANRLRSQILKFEKIDLPGIYLSRLSLGRLSLVSANFKGALLPYADFTNCVCIDVNFANAFLQGAVFEATDLRDAVFDNADCSGSWEDNVFKHTLVSKPIAVPHRFLSTNFSFAILQHFDDKATNFDHCLFTGTTFIGKFTRVNFTECAITHANFSEFESSGQWDGGCTDSVFTKCIFPPPQSPPSSPVINSGRFHACQFFNTHFQVFPAVEFVNCRFENCGFGARGFDAAVSKFAGCKFVQCSFLNIKTNCSAIQCKFVDCSITECTFATFKQCEISGTAGKYFQFEVTNVENVVVGIPPPRTTGTDSEPVGKVPLSVAFNYYSITFRNITGLRSSGVVWRDTFPGPDAKLVDCKFRFYDVQQAQDFAKRVAALPGAKVDTVEGSNGEIKNNVRSGHIPSLVCVNCETPKDDDQFLK